MFRPLVVAAVLSVAALLSAAPIGRVTGLEGEVAVWREGRPLEPSLLIKGLDLEAQDSLVTGLQGSVELVLDKAAGVAAQVRLGPSTAVALDLTALRREQTAVLELLCGSLRVVLPPVSAASRLVIRTGGAQLSSQAAQFSVTMVLGGEVALGTFSGKVSCEVGGLGYLSAPGTVITVAPAPVGAKTLSATVETLDAWISTWKVAAENTTRDQAETVLRLAARRYLQQSGAFLRAWDRWERDSGKVWTLWKAQDAELKMSPAPTLDAEKAQLVGLTANLRQTSGDLERLAYRLGSLRSLVTQGVLPETVELSPGYTARDFYRAFDKDAPDLVTRFAVVRHLQKSWAARNEGNLPQVSAPLDVTRDSAFFR